MLLTGFRRMEVLTLERAWIDAEAPCVRSPRTKSGAQIRAIGQSALNLLVSQSGDAKTPFVFPSELGNGHFVGAVRILQRLCQSAKLEGGDVASFAELISRAGGFGDRASRRTSICGFAMKLSKFSAVGKLWRSAVAMLSAPFSSLAPYITAPRRQAQWAR